VSIDDIKHFRQWGSISPIICRTHLGYGAPHMQDTFKAHGSPLGAA
jgi:transketolase